MSLTLLNTPEKQITLCIDEQSFFVSNVSELDFRWTLPNQQSETKNITVTNVGTTSGTILSIFLPTGFFTTQIFPQTVGIGASLIIPIYFVAASIADYSNNTLINGAANIVSVSLLAVVQSKGLRFDGVNDTVAVTQTVNWERTQAWTMFIKYKNINWIPNLRNCLFMFLSLSTDRGMYLIGEFSNDLVLGLRSDFFGNELRVCWANRSSFPASGTMQITYSGNSDISGFKLYINNVEYTTRDAGSEINSLSGTIVGAGQKLYMASFYGVNRFITDNAEIQEISFVNFVKTVGQLSTDYTNGFQSKGTGDWLFRQSFNVGGTPLALKADVLGGAQVDSTILGQTSGDFVNF
jgi:hypothetical protein